MDQLLERWHSHTDLPIRHVYRMKRAYFFQIFFRWPRFFSPHFLMHNGVLCITFCLPVRMSVTGQKVTSYILSPSKGVESCVLEVKGHMGQGKRSHGQSQIKVPSKGRWEHDSVKLLHMKLIWTIRGNHCKPEEAIICSHPPHSCLW